MAPAIPHFAQYAWPWFLDEREPNTIEAMRLETRQEHEGKSQVYSLDDGRQLSLKDYLALPTTRRRSTLVAVECTNNETQEEIFESTDNLQTLQSTWNIPGPVLRLAFKRPAQFYNTPLTVYSAAGGVTWYICPFPAMLSSVFSYTPGDFNVVFGIQHNAPPREQQLLNVLAIIGHRAEKTRKTNLAHMRRACLYLAENNYIKAACSSSKILCLFSGLFHANFKSWFENFFWISVRCSELSAKLVENAKMFLQADLAVRVDQEIQNVADLRHDIGPAIELINFLLSQFANHASSNTDTDYSNIQIRYVEALQYEQRRLDDMLRHFDRLHDHLQRQWQMAICTVQINQNSLTASNNIAVRKLGEDSQLGAQSMQKLSEQSVADARHMKHLAYLNMVFLPSAVIAAFFSTPFLALDDQLSFRAISRIWILLSICAICTTLTFALSWLLGFSNGKKLSPTALSDKSAEDIMPQADQLLLDRPRQPNLETELIDWDDLHEKALVKIKQAAAKNDGRVDTEEEIDGEKEIQK